MLTTKRAGTAIVSNIRHNTQVKSNKIDEG